MAASGGLLLVAVIVATLSLSLAARCRDGLSSWTAAHFENCTGVEIIINDGKGTLDLSSWTEDNFLQVFSEKSVFGNIMIDGSTLDTIEMKLTPNDNTITVTNCPNLQDLYIDLITAAGDILPIFRISGNRKLRAGLIQDLETNMNEDHIISSDSYIQIANECKLEDANGIVKDVETELKDCKAIYGDFIINGQTALPPDMTKIAELEYIQGCLEITGIVSITRFNDLSFLANTKSKPGGCKNKHIISNNQNLCIHPPEANELRERFPQMEFTGNANCDGECPGGYVVKYKDPTCTIITDSLMVTGNDGQDYKYLENIKEIKGLLEIESTSIVDFTFLDNLEKLNTDNISSDSVISLKYNKDLKSFELPKLKVIGVNPGQVPVYAEANKKLKLDDDFFTKLGLKKNDSIQNEDPNLTTTMATTSAPLTTTISSVKVAARPYDDLALVTTIIIACVVFVVILAGIIASIVYWIWGFYWCCNGKTNSSKWSSHPWSEKPQPIPAIHRFTTDDMTFMDEAEATIKKNKIEIAKLDAKHMSNSPHYEHLTFLNAEPPTYFVTQEELEDYKKYKEERDPKLYPKLTVDKPANIDGKYGIRFSEYMRNRKNASKDIQYRTQPDLLCYLWDKLKIQTVYVDDFSKTAKRMVQAVAGRIADEIILLEKRKKNIREFGINFGMGEKAFKEDAEDNKRDVSNSSPALCYYTHWPDIFFHRYNPYLNKFEMPKESKKYNKLPRTNERNFVRRMVTCLLNVPQGQQLDIDYNDVHLFMQLTYPITCEKPRRISWGVVRNPVSGQFILPINKSHVRIVGEMRGDFDALRKVLSIPSILDGKGHPMLQYNWVFLGNYVSGHPQSLETILLLLGLQNLMGRESVVLLRGALEFSEMNEKYGFRELLTTRFGEDKGDKLFTKFNEIFANFPLNCVICQRICCTSGGFHEADIEGKFHNDDEIRKTQCHLDSTNYNKIFSLPNYTVKYYFDCVDTKGGYYYGERILSQITRKRGWLAFFTTTPMECGLGQFGEAIPAPLFALSSVVGMQGYGGQKTRMAVVAEVNAETEHVSFHGILNENETFKYDIMTGLIDMGSPPETNSAEPDRTQATAETTPSADKDGSESENFAAVVESMERLRMSKAAVSGSKEVASASKEVASKSKEVASKTSQDQV